ncbi:MAG: DUF3017 domain-containing protein [Actinomycetes bacterium]
MSSAHRASGRWTGWPAVPALLVVAAGLVLIGRGEVRRGCVLMALGVAAGAVLRAVLPPDRAGLLVVRRRTTDTAVLVVLAVGLALLGLAVP